MRRYDPLTPEQRKYTMSRVKATGTAPEMSVRRLVHSMGYRYRLHRPDLPGKPDLVFPARRKVIFVHGCFWHGHECEAGRNLPRANRAYWMPKLARNRSRDAGSQGRLREAGWSILVLWECELRNSGRLRNRIRGFLEGRAA